MKVHAIVIATGDIAEKGHAVFGCAIAGPHNLSATPGRRSTVYSRDSTGSILSSMVCDVEADHGAIATRRGPFDKEDLRDFAILTEVLVGSQCRNQLAKDG
jgi:hypothetical protein